MSDVSRFTFLSVTAVLVVGCSEALSNSGACPRTFEFGNHGCAVVRGRVIDQNDMPMAGVLVGLGDGADSDDFSPGYVQTRTDGSFETRFIRRNQLSGANTDSASLWVRAVVQPDLPQMESTIRDSVLIRVGVADVGVIPDTTTVEIRLTVP